MAAIGMLAGALILLSATRAVAQVESSELQGALDSARAAMDIPGISVAIVTPDDRIWRGASGVAKGSGQPAEPNLLYEIGSITKTFTAALVLEIAAEGKLSLDDGLAEWIPDFPRSEGVTIRHLLQHTSGLHNYSENPEYIPALRSDFARVWTPEDSYGYMLEPYFAPGEGWHYSNANYLLLGQVLERATERPLAELLRHLILEPNDLDYSFYEAGEEVPEDRAHAFLDINGDGSPEDLTSLVPNTSFITAAGAAGAIVSTAEDLARWAHALYTGEVVRGRWFEELTSWVERGDGMQYGLGVIRYTPEGRILLGHKGNSVGYSAAVWHAVEDGLTVAVLSNAHAVDVTPIVRLMLERAM